jgi:uncharacterized protein YycO
MNLISKLLLVSGVIFLLTSSMKQVKPKFKDGDIVFQTSRSRQSSMIKKITGSKLTHCGVIYEKKGKLFVIEAVSPVRTIPLNQWISNGVDGKYKVVRLKNELTDSDKKTMFNYAKKQIGKSYDSKFQWSDNKMYCSELVWKVYNSVGVELCETNKFSDYDLDSPEARKAIKSRYKTEVNLNEKVVTPVDIYETNLGDVIYSNY